MTFKAKKMDYKTTEDFGNDFHEINIDFSLVKPPTSRDLFEKLDLKLGKVRVSSSWMSDELYLLKEDVGVRFNSSGVACITTFSTETKKESNRWRDNSITSTKIHRADKYIELTLNQFILNLYKLDLATHKEVEDALLDLNVTDKDSPNISILADYTGLTIDVEAFGETYGIALTRDTRTFFTNPPNNELYIDGITYTTPCNTSLRDRIEQELLEAQSKALNMNILKIENGYLYNNNYYAELDELLEEANKPKEKTNV